MAHRSVEFGGRNRIHALWGAGVRGAELGRRVSGEFGDVLGKLVFSGWECGAVV